MMDTSSRRFFEWIVAHHRSVAVCGLLVCGIALVAARNVRTDYNVEQFFPIWDPERVAYERYKEVFPKEDAQFVLFWREERGLDLALYHALESAVEVFRDVGLADVKWFGNVKVAENIPVDGESALLTAR